MPNHPFHPFRAVPLLLCALALSQPAQAADVPAGGTYWFTPGDFSREESALSGVCITALPQQSLGSIRLGGRTIRTGDVLTTQQLSRLTFCPTLGREDARAVISYLPIFPQGLAPEAQLTISILGREDNAPIAKDSVIETYKNLPNEGLLDVSDPEGQTLTFTVIRQPRRGSLILREDGSYLYTPEKNKVGTDSFTFTASDPAGNVSREATVIIQIRKPSDALQYVDTASDPCRFSAEWLRHQGIFSGESVGPELCFSPAEPVTRGQFLAMVMQTLGLPPDHSGTNRFSDAPGWLRPWLAAAERSGILVTGEDPAVQPDWSEPIPQTEAETLLRGALALASPAALDTSFPVPAFAPEPVPLTRSAAAQLLYAAFNLARQSKFPVL